MSALNPYAPPKAEVADVIDHDPAPELWNPNAASSWSLMFSPVFGAFLHMRNWEALGEPEKATQSRYWMIGSIVFFVLISLAPVLIENAQSLDRFGRSGGLGLLLAWYFGIGKSQQ